RITLRYATAIPDADEPPVVLGRGVWTALGSCPRQEQRNEEYGDVNGDPSPDTTRHGDRIRLIRRSEQRQARQRHVDHDSRDETGRVATRRARGRFATAVASTG